MKISLIIPTANRPEYLKLCLRALGGHKGRYDFDVFVMNDGVQDDTEAVCKQFNQNDYGPKLDIKYVFTGHRNIRETFKSRIPGFAINIGVKLSTSDIIILVGGAEVIILNKAVDYIVDEMVKGRRIMAIPSFMYFDEVGDATKQALSTGDFCSFDLNKLEIGALGVEAVTMPFFMGMHRQDFIEIGGYDEDFIGYAADDNDFVSRMVKNHVGTVRTNAQILHLFHGVHDCKAKPNNPDWVYNYNLFTERKEIIVRNKDRQWGVLGM